MKPRLRVRSTYFDLILRRQKTLEVRPVSGHMRRIGPRNRIIVCSREFECDALVVGKRYYPNLTEAVSQEDVDKIFPRESGMSYNDHKRAVFQSLREIFGKGAERKGIFVFQLKVQRTKSRSV